VTLETGCKDRKMREKIDGISSEKEGGLGKIKRPSVETEGRLTIACHMKNL